MNISQKGIDLIKEFEGCRLTAYYDSVHVLTIGIGTTNADSSIIGTTIYPGMTITQAQAEEWLRLSVNKKYVPLVMKYDNIYHWNQNQLDSLTSFAYNIGSIDQLVQYGKRTISEISNAILYYDKADGQTLAGLTRRRKAEKALFDTPADGNTSEIYGWKHDTKGWWYKRTDSSYPKSCWENINGKDYYFNSEGYMVTNQYIKSSDYKTNGILWYVDEGGVCDSVKYCWKSNSKGYWLAEKSGVWYARTQWLLVDNVWYYALDSGYLAKGTVTIFGRKYKFDKVSCALIENETKGMERVKL